MQAQDSASFDVVVAAEQVARMRFDAEETGDRWEDASPDLRAYLTQCARNDVEELAPFLETRKAEASGERKILVHDDGGNIDHDASYWHWKCLRREDECEELAERIRQLEKALAPFAGCGITDDGKPPAADYAYAWPYMQDRIVDWFGPSDFRLARAALSSHHPVRRRCRER